MRGVKFQGETFSNPTGKRSFPFVGSKVMVRPLDTIEKTAVLLIAHGSRRQSANDDLHELAARLATRGAYSIVVASFLELAEPGIQQGGDRCVELGATRVLLLPYFLSAGVHLRRDLTAARDDLESRHPRVEFRLGRALGPHPLLDALVEARIVETDSHDRATNRHDHPRSNAVDTESAKH